MRKPASLLLCILMMLALMIPYTNAMSDEWNGYIIGSIVNGPAILYQNAHISSMPVTRLPNGTDVVLFDTYGQWYYVRQLGSETQGWLPRENFQISDFCANELKLGIVLSEFLTVRETPSVNGNKVTTIYTHDYITILEEQDEWYYIQLDYPNQNIKGWVLKDYIAYEFSTITTQTPTVAYAMPSLSAKKVALLAIDTQLFIIDAFDDFWVVSLRGASAFISMRDVVIHYETLY